jgi:glutamate-1-semialdehyde 2,1-aminomutase
MVTVTGGSDGLGRLVQRAAERVAAKTRASADLFVDARDVIPGGVTSGIRAFDPHPLFVREARGAQLWDADGNEYVDCRLGFGPVLLGHFHEALARAVTTALSRGTVYALSHTGELELARKVIQAVPNAEMATFCSSGSEATLHAIRLARGYTGRQKIAKFEGGYHGVHDTVMVGVQHRPDLAGPPEAPLGVADSAGIPEATVANTRLLPFNHPAAIDAIAAGAHELAAVIVEPVQGAAGSIPAQPAFLQALREVTARHGVLLIFDEVITGFRLALGGAQERYGIRADLATFGKILGGGLPFGALTGPREIMRLLSRAEAARLGRAPVTFGGTFNGNPASVAAANATLDYLTEHRGLYAEVNARGDRLRREVAARGRAHGLPLSALGDGSVFAFRFVPPLVRNIRDFAAEDPRLPQALFLLLLAEGVLTHPAHSFLSAAHTDADIDRIIEAHDRVLAEIARARAGR